MKLPMQQTPALTRSATISGEPAGVRSLAALVIAFAAVLTPGTGYSQSAPDGSYRVMANGVIYTVSKGETLSDISRQFTGNVNHWRAIGHTNRINNDRTIPIGRQVLIPASLLAPKSAYARIDSFLGNVRIKSKNGDGIEAKIGALLKEGDTLMTLANSFISLVLDDGTRFTLPPDSTLNLRMLRGTQYIDLPRTQLYLEKGRVDSNVTHRKSQDALYEVISPMAVSGVRGTRFRVNVSDGKVLNEVLEGKVAVNGSPGKQAASNEKLVATGYGAIVEKGKVSKPVTLLQPPSLAEGYQLQQRLPVQFSFSHSQASAFLASISNDAAGTSNIAESREANSSSTAVSKFDKLEDGTYYIHYSAIDSNGLQGVPASRQFTVKARPFPPFLLQPGARFQNNETDGKVSVYMKWSEVEGVSGYRLQVAADATFEQPVVDLNINEPVSGKTVYLKPGIYFWRLASVGTPKDRADQGPFGDAKKLEVIAGQTPPSVSVGEEEISFSWPGMSGQRFTFQISESQNFEALTQDMETTEPAAKVRGLSSGTYYVRVRSIDPDGFIGAFSPAQRFFIPVVWRTQYGEPVKVQGSSMDATY